MMCSMACLGVGSLSRRAGGRVAGPFFVGAEIEAEEGGLEFATGLDSRFLDPLVWGPSIAAVPSERIKIPEVYGSPGIRGGNHSAAVCPGDQVHGVLCQG